MELLGLNWTTQQSDALCWTGPLVRDSGWTGWPNSSRSGDCSDSLKLKLEGSREHSTPICTSKSQLGPIHATNTYSQCKISPHDSLKQHAPAHAGNGKQDAKTCKNNDCKELCALWWATLEQDDSDSDWDSMATFWNWQIKYWQGRQRNKNSHFCEVLCLTACLAYMSDPKRRWRRIRSSHMPYKAPWVLIPESPIVKNATISLQEVQRAAKDQAVASPTGCSCRGRGWWSGAMCPPAHWRDSSTILPTVQLSAERRRLRKNDSNFQRHLTQMTQMHSNAFKCTLVCMLSQLIKINTKCWAATCHNISLLHGHTGHTSWMAGTGKRKGVELGIAPELAPKKSLKISPSRAQAELIDAHRT